MELDNCCRSGWTRNVKWLLLLGLFALTVLVSPAALTVDRASSVAQVEALVGQFSIEQRPSEFAQQTPGQFAEAIMQKLMQDQEVEQLAVQWNNTRVS